MDSISKSGKQNPVAQYNVYLKITQLSNIKYYFLPCVGEISGTF